MKSDDDEEQEDPEPLDSQEISSCAERHGYEEWYRCDRSRSVLAFRKEGVRFQVYPVTYTMSVFVVQGKPNPISLCDDHADATSEYGELLNTNKRHLYAVQDVDMDKLDAVLKDPLQYGQERGLVYSRNNALVEADEWSVPLALDVDTKCSNCNKVGEYYGRGSGHVKLRACTNCKRCLYCSRDCQKAHWKQGHRNNCSKQVQCDAARRWHHVMVATGVHDRCAPMTHQIEQFCQDLDYVLFEPDGPPCLHRGRYICGSSCALANMLLDVGREHHDVIGFASIESALAVMRGEADSLPDYVAQFNPCGRTDEFLEEFGSEVEKLREDLVAMPGGLRRELLQWHFERIRCSWGVCMVQSDEKPLLRPVMTYPLHFCHMDYSRLVYGTETEDAMCFMHGTLHGGDGYDHEEEESAQGGSDDGTEATASIGEDDDLEEEEDQSRWHCD